MQLYNSLKNELEAFNGPLDGKTVRLYSCGPTVYNNLHIGNLSAFIYADVLRRTLATSGYKVEHVMNITDVDDKTIRDSKRDYPDDNPKIALKKLTDKYAKVFMDDLMATGNGVADITFISAVDTIPEIIELIQKIIDNGFAYRAEDGVYFSINAYIKAGHPYGLLQKLQLSQAKSRVNNDEYDKDNASDFALWKTEVSGEPSWEATFCVGGKVVSMPGRPGWHIECSAMSQKLLGVPFDIHTGGIDLKFPHHENEIAQSCGAGASELARYFVHNNHILVDGRKMSKSLGNFYTLRDIEEREYTAQDFRMLVLQSHYRSESNFSWELLEAAKNRLSKWRTISYMRWQSVYKGPDRVRGDLFEGHLLSLLQEDLNTPGAIAYIDEVFDEIQAGNVCEACIDNVLEIIDACLGIKIATSDYKDITGGQKQLLTRREDARASKNWVESDRIRDELKAQGIGINDSPGGQVWFRL